MIPVAMMERLGLSGATAAGHLTRKRPCRVRPLHLGNSRASGKAGGPKGQPGERESAHLWPERRRGLGSAGSCSPAHGWAAKGRGQDSLALSLRIRLGGRVEPTQLCPVIGRDCKASRGRGVGKGAAGGPTVLLPCTRAGLPEACRGHGRRRELWWLKNAP